jgi:hypothetical protein
MPKYSGGCLCGGVRYEYSAEPAMTAVCHCTHCQKTSGSAFSVVLGVPADSVQVTKSTTLATYKDMGTSGQPVLRKFCSACGSPVISDAAAFPGILFIKVGTLDDVSAIKPGLHIWTASAQPWVSIDETAKSFAGNPG